MITYKDETLEQLIKYINGKNKSIDRAAILVSSVFVAGTICGIEFVQGISTAFTILGASIAPEIEKGFQCFNRESKEYEALDSYERCEFAECVLARLSVKHAVEKMTKDKERFISRWKISDKLRESRKQEIKKMDIQRENKFNKLFIDDSEFKREAYWNELIEVIEKVIDLKEKDVLEFRIEMKKQIITCYRAFKIHIERESDLFHKYNLTAGFEKNKEEIEASHNNLVDYMSAEILPFKEKKDEQHQNIDYKQYYTIIEEDFNKDFVIKGISLRDMYMNAEFESLNNCRSWKINQQGVDDLEQYVCGWVNGEDVLSDDFDGAKVMLLLGQPGHGKSSFCKKIMNEYINNNNYLKKSRKVFLVRFLDISDSNLDDFMKDPLSQITLIEPLPENLQVKDLEGSLILFDGYDELYLSLQEKGLDFKELVSKLKSKIRYKDIKILITSRASCFDLKEFSSSSIPVIKLKWLSLEKQIGWLSLYRRRYKESLFTENRLKKIHKNDDNLRELMKIPILFQLIVYYDINDNVRNKTELYSILFEKIIFIRTYEENNERHNSSKGIEDIDLLKIFEEAALEIYKNNEQYAYIENISVNSKDICSKISNAFISFYFRKRSKNNKGIVEFVHKSFYEYFLAREIYKCLLKAIENEDDALELQEKLCFRVLDNEVLKHIQELSEYNKDDNIFVCGNENNTKRHMTIILKTIKDTECVIQRNSSDKLHRRLEASNIVFINIYNLMNAICQHDYFETIEDKKTLSYLIKFYQGSINLLNINLSGLDLSGANLPLSNLSEANLSKANLNEVNLRRANLSGTNLSGANLKGADLRDANLSRVNLNGAYLRKANLSGANLRGVDLKGVDLRWADIKGADLRETDLMYANLSKSNLKKVNLSGANLRGADLRGADLTYTILSEQFLSETDLREADLSETDLRGLTLDNINLRGANLTGANLSRASIIGVDLSETDLIGANLSRAYLSGSSLKKANLTGANFRGADLSGVDFKELVLGGVNISHIQINKYGKLHPWNPLIEELSEETTS